MKGDLKILVIEDSPADFMLLERQLGQSGLPVYCTRVDNREGITRALKHGVWDLVISDYSLPSISFREGFDLVKSGYPELPVILVSGSVGEVEAVELLKMGVADYVLKENIVRIVPAIKRCMQEIEELHTQRIAEALLRESEERYRNLFENMLEGYAHCRMIYREGLPVDYRYIKVNAAFEHLSGLRDVTGKKVSEIIPGYCRDNPDSLAVFGRVALTGKPEQWEHCLASLDKSFMFNVFSPAKGEFVVVSRDVSDQKKYEKNLRNSTLAAMNLMEDAILARDKSIETTAWLELEIQERKQAENELRESEEKFRKLFMESQDALMTTSASTWMFTSVNPAALKMFGVSSEAEYITLTPELLSPEFQPDGQSSADKSKELIKTALWDGFISFEWRHKKLHGKEFDAEVNLTSIETKGETIVLATVHDITDKKHAEEAQKATLELLHICNNTDNLPDLMQELMHFFHREAGCEAVGVRLRKGDDYPYFETSGFPDEFIQSENELCTRDETGKLVRDCTGQPALECMCGNIIYKRVDSSSPFFTPHGSFWTNYFTELLANISDADRKTINRGHCNRVGYESVALIPLRYKNETFGLFQFNNRQRDCFTPEKIALFENLSNYISIALSKLMSDDALQESEQLNLQIINCAKEGVVVYDIDKRFQVWNPFMEQITGLTKEQVLGKHPLEVLPFLKDIGLLENIDHALKGETTQIDFPFRNPSIGRSGWATDISTPLRNAHGEIIGVIGIVRDITERKQYELELEHLANHDTLTGLANRNLLNDRLEQSMIFADRSHRTVAVLLIDIDQFKRINDSLGHSIGDQLLQMVATRLNGCVRAGDTVSRLGGDEFVISLAEVADQNDVGILTKKIRDFLAVPFPLEGRELKISVSIGISLYPKDGRNVETLMRNADIAMYRAKEERDTYRFFSPEMNLRISGILELEADMVQALKREEFTLHYQPKIEIDSGRILGCEALVRWKHPQRGMVSPIEFIPIAEETGLIVQLGEWVLKEACTQAAAWLKAGLMPIRMAVNLSARQFRQSDLGDRIKSILNLTGLTPSSLDLELTESMIMHDPDGAVKIMHHLKEFGIGLSLDDFGTGYSSLNYLRSFPFDCLKIDRSFIKNVATDPDSAALARSIVDIAHILRMNTVAEGVENWEQADFLSKCGCDEIQGFLFSKPLPAAEFEELLREGRSMTRVVESETN